ncbi:MAG TPA: UDP-3-O-(3-hydroxymyristoyl)glucosamine N-acyltransferase [bacterium]|nr:UDP-3-O-(3-hydroxymyristoyl)glucosamine N-acyltransferase [bacterium]
MGVSFTLKSLAAELGASFEGDGETLLKGVAPLESATEGHLTFVTNPKYLKAALSTRASAILCGEPVPGWSKPLLLSKNPYSDLARTIAFFHPETPLPTGVQAGSWICASAQVHPSATVMPGAFIGEKARVGAGSVLFPGVFIGEGSVVGDGCRLYPNSVVREGCVLGHRVILQPGAVVGSDGFGFAKEGAGYRKIPQVGNVVLEDDVELGANTCVDRAVLGTTRIGQGTKLDNLIQIGHNVVIGKHTVMAALTGISGSTQVGDQVVMGGQVGLAGHIKIGDQVVLATRTGVMEDIPEKGVYFGAPHNTMTAEMKNVAAYRQLPEMLRRIRSLERELEGLKGNQTHGG